MTSKNDNTEEDFEEGLQFCEACGGMLKPEKVNLEEFENGKLYMMENVLAYICALCGEMWVPEPILNEFEKMIETTHKYHEEQQKSHQENPPNKKMRLKRRIKNEKHKKE